MKHEFLDHHREGNSPVHGMDPRLKLLLMGAYILMVVTTPAGKPLRFLYLSLFPLFLMTMSGISILHFLGKLLRLYPMIFLITFLLPFFPSDGEPVIRLGAIALYPEGVQKFLLINIKSVLALLISIVLTTTTDFNRLLKAMERLYVPDVVVATLSFMYRFIFLIIDEAERMVMAFHSRYIRLPLLVRLKMVASQIGVLFIRTYERGERVNLAMEARGFTGTVRVMNALNWRQQDTWWMMGVLLFLGIGFMI